MLKNLNVGFVNAILMFSLILFVVNKKTRIFATNF